MYIHVNVKVYNTDTKTVHWKFKILGYHLGLSVLNKKKTLGVKIVLKGIVRVVQMSSFAIVRKWFNCPHL